jgi:hypothetical protein
MFLAVTVCHILADIITKKYGSDTEIGTTIRDMPWPNWVPLKVQHGSNIYNALCQVGAICGLLFSQGNLMDMAFVIIFPIQLSTFLMTLVRKGLIQGIWWHILYAIFWILRFKWKWNKYVIWGVIFCGFMYFNFYSTSNASVDLKS